LKTLGALSRSANMGRYRASDGRTFQVAARDTAGNVGAKTRKLVVVPSVRNFTLADATARLKARGLKRGALSYSYSDSIASGRVIRGMVSGLVTKGTAVGLRISRGGQPRTPAPTTTPPSYSPPPFSPPPSGYPTTGLPTGTGSPTASPTPAMTPSPIPSSEASGSPTPSPDPETVEPESFSPAEEEASGLRRLLGLGLLGGAFVAAGAVALKARGHRSPMPREDGMGELLFWDQRLARAVSSALRRLVSRG
jgi:hypothetical protein